MPERNSKGDQNSGWFYLFFTIWKRKMVRKTELLWNGSMLDLSDEIGGGKKANDNGNGANLSTAKKIICSWCQSLGYRKISEIDGKVILNLL